MVVSRSLKQYNMQGDYVSSGEAAAAAAIYASQISYLGCFISFAELEFYRFEDFVYKSYTTDYGL